MDLEGELPRSLSLWDTIPFSRSCKDAFVEPHWSLPHQHRLSPLLHTPCPPRCACLDWEPQKEDDPTVLNVSAAFLDVRPFLFICPALLIETGGAAHQRGDGEVSAPVLAVGREGRGVRQALPPQGRRPQVQERQGQPHPALGVAAEREGEGVKDYDGFVADLSGHVAVATAQYQLRIRTTPGDGLFEVTVSNPLPSTLLPPSCPPSSQVPLDLKTGKVEVSLDFVSHINAFGDAPHCIIDKDYFVAKFCVCYDRIKPATK